MNAVTYRDRLRRVIQDGQTSDGEALTVARLEDLSDQVGQQATPTGTSFQVRFAATPTEGAVAAFVVPGTLVAFVDTNPAPVQPSVDVDAVSGVFTLPTPPAELLQVSYAWAYFQARSLDAFLDDARMWSAGPSTFPNLEAVPDGLTGVIVAYAAAQALRALAAKCSLATARSGESSRDYSDLAKSYTAQAKEQHEAAEQGRKSYYSRADQPLAPVAAAEPLAIAPYQPRR